MALCSRSRIRSRCAPTAKVKLQHAKGAKTRLCSFCFLRTIARKGCAFGLVFAALMFTLEPVASLALKGDGFRDFEKGAGRVRQVGILAIDEAQLAFQLQFPNGDAYELPAGDFIFHADLGQKSHAVSHRHKLFDGLQGREFEIHVQRCFVTFEELQNFLTVRRRNDMGNKRFGAELPNAYPRSGREGMLWRNDEDEFIEEDDDGVKTGLLRFIGENPEFDVVAENVVGDMTAERAFDGNLDHGMQAAELGQYWKEIKCGEFVCGDHKFALLQFPQLSQRFVGIVAQV
jgi:hypothetical protein